jgi:hypothetical protein
MAAKLTLSILPNYLGRNVIRLTLAFLSRSLTPAVSRQSGLLRSIPR